MTVRHPLQQPCPTSRDPKTKPYIFLRRYLCGHPPEYIHVQKTPGNRIHHTILPLPQQRERLSSTLERCIRCAKEHQTERLHMCPSTPLRSLGAHQGEVMGDAQYIKDGWAYAMARYKYGDRIGRPFRWHEQVSEEDHCGYGQSTVIRTKGGWDDAELIPLPESSDEEEGILDHISLEGVGGSVKVSKSPWEDAFKSMTDMVTQVPEDTLRIKIADAVPIHQSTKNSNRRVHCNHDSEEAPQDQYTPAEVCLEDGAPLTKETLREHGHLVEQQLHDHGSLTEEIPRDHGPPRKIQTWPTTEPDSSVRRDWFKRLSESMTKTEISSPLLTKGTWLVTQESKVTDSNLGIGQATENAVLNAGQATKRRTWPAPGPEHIARRNTPMRLSETMMKTEASSPCPQGETTYSSDLERMLDGKFCPSWDVMACAGSSPIPGMQPHDSVGAPRTYASDMGGDRVQRTELSEGGSKRKTVKRVLERISKKT